MAKSTKQFILHDEKQKNSYGFRVSTDGIDMSRFADNPVMLSNHENRNEAVLGRWTNATKTAGLITAYPEFDSEDQNAKEIEGKVERGFIKGASIGLLFSVEDMIFVEGELFLEKSELIEASITPVPSNRRALCLYLRGREDEPLTEKEVKELCLSVQANPEQLQIPQKNMSKINLAMRCLIALGFKDAPSDGMEKTEIETHIMNLSAKLEASEAKVITLTSEKTALEAKLGTQAQTEIAGVIDQAIVDGKIPATTKDAYLSMAKTNPEAVKTTLEAIPAKASLGAGLHPAGSASATAGDVKTAEDFIKLSAEAKKAWKADNPEAYKKLFA